MVKIIHLVLYNASREYKAMYYHSRNWYREFVDKGIETWYYVYNNNISEPRVDEKEMKLELPGEESYTPGILQKTLAAFRFATQRGFDLLIRSNVSTIVNIPNLLQHYDHVRLNPLLYGGPHIMTTIKHKELGTQCFVQGTCMLFAPDTVKLLLEHEKDLCLSAEDDVSFAALLKKHNVVPTNIGNQFADFGVFQNVDNVSAYRNHTFESDRKDNIANIRLEVNALFQRHVFLKEPKQVQRVLYFNQDITHKLATLSTGDSGWSTSQDNTQLDDTFGDPSPGLPKNLMVYFTDVDAAPLTQRCNLRFSHRDGKLFVC